jgi:hypothetical protein
LLLTHAAHEANPADAVELKFRTQQGDGTGLMFAAIPNERGALGRLESDPYRADNFVDAERRAWDALMPALSGYSATLDMPLVVEHVVVTDIERSASRATMLTPFFEAPIAAAPNAALAPELRAYVSVYREGMNTNSSTHQFLCFYKIIESVRARRERIQGERLSRGEPVLRYQHERIPADRDSQIKWVQALFPFNEELDEFTVGMYVPDAASGRKLNHIIDKTLCPIRDSIAHALFDDANRELLISTDSALNIFDIDEWLPLTKCIARRNLKNEFPHQFLVGVPEPTASIADE